MLWPNPDAVAVMVLVSMGARGGMKGNLAARVGVVGGGTLLKDVRLAADGANGAMSLGFLFGSCWSAILDTTIVLWKQESMVLGASKVTQK
jgi:hypothetical protein